MKRRIVVILTLLLIIISYSFYFGYYRPNFELDIFKNEYHTSLINEKMNNYKIVVFSDLKLNDNYEEIDEAINLINQQHPDLIIFAGDIFIERNKLNISEEDISYIKDKFDTLEARYGKFAVYGDVDMNYPEIVSDILYSTDFELLDNENIKISNQSSEYFNLIGLQPTINNEYEVSTVYQDNLKEKLTVSVCHTPNIFSEISDYTNILLSAHTLGGENILPLIGPIESLNGYDKYYNGNHTEDYSTIIITNGIGKESESRMFATPNIVELTIYSK